MTTDYAFVCLVIKIYMAVRPQLQSYNAMLMDGKESYSTGDIDIAGRAYGFRGVVYTGGDGDWTRILSIRTENMLIALNFEPGGFGDLDEPIHISFGINNHQFVRCPAPRFEVLTTPELAADDFMYLKLISQ